MIGVVILGERGYIGSNLSQKLRSDGFETYSVMMGESRSNIFFELHQNACGSVVVHLASPNEKSPLPRMNETHSAVVEYYSGFEESLAKSRASKLIYISTARVYDGSDQLVVTATTPIFPLSAYANWHAVSEGVLERICRNQGIAFSVVRLSNVFGGSLESQRSRSGIVPVTFYQELLNSQKVTVRSGRHQRRDFVHIDHVADHIVAVISRPLGEVTVCASGVSQRVFDIAMDCAAAFGRQVSKSAKVIVGDSQTPQLQKFQPFLEDREVVAKLRLNHEEFFAGSCCLAESIWPPGGGQIKGRNPHGCRVSSISR